MSAIILILVWYTQYAILRMCLYLVYEGLVGWGLEANVSQQDAGKALGERKVKKMLWNIIRGNGRKGTRRHICIVCNTYESLWFERFFVDLHICVFHFRCYSKNELGTATDIVFLQVLYQNLSTTFISCPILSSHTQQIIPSFTHMQAKGISTFLNICFCVSWVTGTPATQWPGTLLKPILVMDWFQPASSDGQTKHRWPETQRRITAC